MRWAVLPEVAAILLALAVSACDQGLPHAWSIERTRVLGAKVEVIGDEARAWPLPGETARVTWLVVDPAEPAPLGWAFIVCVPSLAGCEGAPVSIAMGASRPPSLDVLVPAGPSEPSVLRVLGAICARGTPRLDAETQSVECDGDGAERTLATMSIPIARPGDPTNASPSLSDDEITLDAMPWPEAIAIDTGCSPDSPRIAAGSGKHTLVVRFVGDRERYVETTSGAEQWETLQMSHYATAGSLDRQYTVIEPDNPDEAPEGTVEWEAPAAPPGADMAVRFHLVLRDLRGGTDWATREVCVPSG